ncbi:MAG: oxygen-independent coproporphyrinogen III oxidase [Deltaproteobacteria bacterium]|nr:oxygen-independent coproporphyrinogen III oxidase [Deltaproteobacteria bacterium]
MAATVVDPQLILKLARPGPRYTSYPTVPVWTTSVDSDVYRERLAAADVLDRPLSLYFHVPFCRERCHYCGCNVVITGRQEKADRYIDYLIREVDMALELMPNRRRVDQIHLGGGTPTFLDEPQLLRLLAAIDERFNLVSDAELALEVDPRVTTREQLALLRGFGFNRLSIGVQDFTPEVQRAVGRVQEVELTEALYDYARHLGYSGVNFDLIYGLPLQEETAYRKTVETVLRLRPDRVAMFSYAHVPWIHPQQKRYDAEPRPGPLDKIALFLQARQQFFEAGYVAIGMDHFALPSDELAVARMQGRLYRNFQGYTPRETGDTIAFGASAISDVADSYTQSIKPLSAYYQSLDAGRFPIERGWLLTAEDLLRRETIQQLMCNFTADLEALAARHGCSAEQAFSAQLQPLDELEALGLIKRDGWQIEVREIGQILVRNVAMVFDAHLSSAPPERPTFSQTV